MVRDRAKPIAVVTGGHRRLGARIAGMLSGAGYALALHGSHDVALDDELALELGGEDTSWHGFVADFEVEGAATALMREIISHFGRAPDLLVNSAAIFGQDRLEDVSEQALLRHYRVNCMASVLLSQAFAAVESRRGEGRCIVNILDQRLVNPHTDQLSYTLSKQALAGFTRIAARDLAGRGIRVNAVAPGLTIATDDYDELQMARLAGMMPLGHLPQPQQIAEAVLYLARAQAVTGQVIAVDSGAHMQSFERDFLYL
jgi:NAD(P)-dependent dehydrogenase (short-subunit alcohol dehydrogenase family)